jgi:hypothetical protein
MESSKTPDADGAFSKAPIFNFNDGKLKFDTNDVSNANDNYGTVSGFLPKYLIVHKMYPYKDTFCFKHLLFLRSNPTTQHTTNLIKNLLK